MRSFWIFLCAAAAAAWASTSHAAETLQFGKPGEWVVPASLPASGNALPDAPVAILLSDNQFAFLNGTSSTYSETALKIQTAQGLAAGNLSIGWNPATETVTVHKLHVKHMGAGPARLRLLPEWQNG